MIFGIKKFIFNFVFLINKNISKIIIYNFYIFIKNKILYLYFCFKFLNNLIVYYYINFITYCISEMF